MSETARNNQGPSLSEVVFYKEKAFLSFNIQLKVKRKEESHFLARKNKIRTGRCARFGRNTYGITEAAVRHKEIDSYTPGIAGVIAAAFARPPLRLRTSPF